MGFWRKCYIELLYLMEKYEKNASRGRVSKKMLHWIIVSDGQMKKEYIKWWGFEENVALNYCIWWRNEERIHQVVGFQRKMLHWIIVSNGEIKKESIKWWVSKKILHWIIVFDGEIWKKNLSSGRVMMKMLGR